MADYSSFGKAEMTSLWFFDYLNSMFPEFEYLSIKYKPLTVIHSKNLVIWLAHLVTVGSQSQIENTHFDYWYDSAIKPRTCKVLEKFFEVVVL